MEYHRGRERRSIDFCVDHLGALLDDCSNDLDFEETYKVVTLSIAWSYFFIQSVTPLHFCVDGFYSGLLR